MIRHAIALGAAVLLLPACSSGASPAAPVSTSDQSVGVTPSVSASANPSPAATGPASNPAAAPATGGVVEDTNGIRDYLRLTLPSDVVWTARPLPPPAGTDVRHGAWGFTRDGASYLSCALRVTVQSGFTGDLTALKLAFEQPTPGTTVTESTLTRGEHGTAQELVQASTGRESAKDGSTHPFTTWAHTIITPGGTFLQVVGVAHDDAASTCQAEAVTRGFTSTGKDFHP